MRPLSYSETSPGQFHRPVLLVNFTSRARLLWTLTATVIGLGIFRELFVAVYGVDTIFQDMRHINLDAEQCLGAWFGSAQMLACAILLWLISRQATLDQHRDRHYWTVLSLIFFALSLDEATSVHELVIEPLQHVLHTSGPFLFAWVIPALIFVPVFFLFYVGFLLRLPARFAIWFLVSGALYVAGALGMEMVGGAVATHTGEQGLYYILCYVTEESLEMIGMTSFMLALIRFIDSETDEIRVAL